MIADGGQPVSYLVIISVEVFALAMVGSPGFSIKTSLELCEAWWFLLEGELEFFHPISPSHKSAWSSGPGLSSAHPTHQPLLHTTICPPAGFLLFAVWVAQRQSRVPCVSFPAANAALSGSRDVGTLTCQCSPVSVSLCFSVDHSGCWDCGGMFVKSFHTAGHF